MTSRPLRIAAVVIAFLGVACGQVAHRATPSRAHHPTAATAPAPVQVTGDTPAEVAFVESILKTLPAPLVSVNVGAPPKTVPMQPDPGTVWISAAYPSGASRQAMAADQWWALELYDAYSVGCDQASVPCASGVTVADTQGSGGFSSRLDAKADSPAAPSQPVSQLISLYQGAAQKAGVADAKVSSYVGDGPVFVIRGTASDSQAFLDGLDNVLQPNGVGPSLGVLVEVDKPDGSPLVVAGNSDAAGTDWIDPEALATRLGTASGPEYSGGGK